MLEWIKTHNADFEKLTIFHQEKNYRTIQTQEKIQVKKLKI